MPPLEHPFCCGLIAAGAGLMGYSIRSLRRFRRCISLLPPDQGARLSRQFGLLKGLMVFFLLGYLTVLGEYLAGTHSLSDSAVASIFFLGAVFVLVSLRAQEQLSSRLASVLREIVPVCMYCGSVRRAGEEEQVQESWIDMGKYLQTSARVSHGLCPACAKKHYPGLAD